MSRTPAPPCSTGLLSTALAIAAAGAAASAPAQSILTFDSRNGANTAYCGPIGAGPGALHRFQTPDPTHDVIDVTEPGGPSWPASAARSQIDATPDPTRFSIAMAGSATRAALGPGFFGVDATADVRDSWTMTVTVPARFALAVTLDAASNESVVSAVTFLVVPLGIGASVIPDPGTPAPPYGASLRTPGTFALAASGKLTPGQYLVSLHGQALSNFNSYPFTGSFTGSIVLDLSVAATVTARNGGSNPASYACGLPILGQTWSGSVDVARTGHGFALWYGSLSPAQLALPGGQTLLLGGTILPLLGPLPGPLATFSLNLPPSGALAGVGFSTQAVHFGGAPGFALSNAQDLVFGS